MYNAPPNIECKSELVNHECTKICKFGILTKGADEMEGICERIEALLRERGISGSRMSADLGMSRSFMTELRKGRAKGVSAENAARIAEYLGVSTDYLLGNTDRPEKQTGGDAELAEYLEELRSRPEKRMLFSVTKNATKSQIEAIVRMIEEMQQGE